VAGDISKSIAAVNGYVDWDVPICIEYVLSRFNGLVMEVLGVAVIVPNAIYPGSYQYSRLVFAGDVVAALLAIVLKLGFFDVEPVDAECHAVRRSQFAAVLFLHLNPFTLFGMCGSGAGIPLLLDATGRLGDAAETRFAQQVVCTASFVTWASLTATKLLHKPISSPVIHRAKTIIQGAGAAACLVPLAVPVFPDFITLVYIVMINALIVVAQLVLPTAQPGRWGSMSRLRRTHSAETTRDDISAVSEFAAGAGMSLPAEEQGTRVSDPWTARSAPGDDRPPRKRRHSSGFIGF